MGGSFVQGIPNSTVQFVLPWIDHDFDGTILNLASLLQLLILFGCSPCFWSHLHMTLFFAVLVTLL